MPAAKQYEVIVRFDRQDPKTGKETSYEVGASWNGSHPATEKYLHGVDSQGPLIREKVGAPVQSADSTDKEN